MAEFVRVPVAEVRFPGQLREQVREGVRVRWVAESRREQQAVLRPALARLEAFLVVGGLWRLIASISSGVRQRTRHERLVLSSLITMRVLAVAFRSRFLRRLTERVPRRVRASRSKAFLMSPRALPRRSPKTRAGRTRMPMR